MSINQSFRAAPYLRGHPSEEDVMSISAISSAVPQYLVPTTPKAKIDDERTESMATKAKEAETGKEAAAKTSKSAVDFKV